MNLVSLDRKRQIFGFQKELGPNFFDGRMFVRSNFDRVVNVLREQFVPPTDSEPLTDQTNIEEAEEDPRGHRDGSLSVGLQTSDDTIRIHCSPFKRFGIGERELG